MKIKINDREKEIEKSVSITELLKLENVKMVEMVSVEWNGTVLNREELDTTKVNESDEVNFLYFMGGGV